VHFPALGPWVGVGEKSIGGASNFSEDRLMRVGQFQAKPIQ